MHRDVVTAMEAALGRHMQSLGYEVVETTASRHRLDESLFARVLNELKPQIALFAPSIWHGFLWLAASFAFAHYRHFVSRSELPNPAREAGVHEETITFRYEARRARHQKT